MTAYNDAMVKLDGRISELFDLRCKMAKWDELSAEDKIACLWKIYIVNNKVEDAVKFVQGVAKILEELSPIVVGTYLQKIAKEYNVSETALRREIGCCTDKEKRKKKIKDILDNASENADPAILDALLKEYMELMK